MKFVIEFPNPTGEIALFHLGRKSPHFSCWQARDTRFGQKLGRLGVWEITVFPGKPTLIVTKLDGAACLLEKAPSQTGVDEYVKWMVRSAPAHQKMSSISGTDLPDL